MKAAHVKDLSHGFGRAVSHFRTERFATVEMLATTSDVGENTVVQIESGIREPTLSQFLRLALALHVTPGHLFNRAVVEWRDDPGFALPLNRSRAHCPRLFRLAWIAERRVIHESRKAYETFDEALRASVSLNVIREQERLPPFVGVGVYLRTGNVWNVHDFIRPTESHEEQI